MALVAAIELMSSIRADRMGDLCGGRTHGLVTESYEHRGGFGAHGIGRSAIFLIKHLVGGKADFDREPQPRPQRFASDRREMREAGIGEPVGDVAMRFEAYVNELRRS